MSKQLLPRTLVSHLHFDGTRLQSWMIDTEDGPQRRPGGRLVVLRTSRTGERTIIEQAGHPVDADMANTIHARVKPLKQRA